MYLARVIGPEGTTWWEGAVPHKLPYFKVAAMNNSWVNKLSEHPDTELPIHELNAHLERELPVEDGGPLLIYRIGAKDVLIDNR